MSDAVGALIEWCNEQGGINGRQVKGNYYDASITEVNNVMTEACTQVFMLVGQGFALGVRRADPSRLWPPDRPGPPRWLRRGERPVDGLAGPSRSTS